MIPGSVTPLLLASQAGDYEVSRSLRFNSSDSAFCSRTPASAGNRKTWTWAGWVKRCKFGTDTWVLRANSTGSDFFLLGFGSSNQFYLTYTAGLSGAGENYTSAVFRDPSAWYHLVCAFDSTQATATNRIKLYVNGVQQTLAVSNPPTLNADYQVNSTNEHRIGGFSGSYGDYYLADVHFIDGQALDPSSFTEVSATTGQLIPKAYTGSYGTNGFHLPFSDNSTAAALGTDTSGNGNDWTPNNLSVTAGAGNDSLVDTPSSTGTDTGAGGEVRGNYCTWNPLINGDTAANGNLDVTNDTARGTQKLLEYDAYWEITSTGGTTTAGVVSDGGTTNTTTVADGKTYGFKLSAAGALEYINITDGGSFTSITTGLTGIQFPYASAASSTTGSLNAGQRLFAATAPSGFKALCDTNLPAPVVAQPSTVMDVKLYTGNGSTQTISGLGFSPDLVWIKERNAAADHALYDTVRGVQQQLESNTTTDETTESTGLTAFNSDGFALSSLAQVNTNTDTYVAWCWDKSATAGFDIVTYTGNGSARTISHGLGVAPNMIIVKARTTASTDQGWAVYHSANTANPETDYLLLNSTAATADLDTVWNDTAPTSSVFSVGTNALVNVNNDTYVAYLFSAVVGYSSFGSYTGNGSTDGPFIYTGMRPKFLIYKRTDAADTFGWIMIDSSRDSYNVVTKYLGANTSAAEGTVYIVDFLSNGFKLRLPGADGNVSGGTYIYAAFAENPFQYARAR